MAQEVSNKTSKHSLYPPVVSVLGHVDHGKTSLLDKIRQTGIADREIGGITQKIGASQIEITHESVKRTITFIDTPGHEAFANMRSQGVNAADIVLLVVASDDGIKPQTKESIQKIHEAKIPYIVVFTKSDLEGAQVQKVKQQLLAEQVLLEGLGGEVPYIEVSSKTGHNIQELLDLILLVYDMSSPQKDEKTSLLSVVIDAKLDKRRGVVATVVLKQGILSTGDKLYIPGKEVGKVRALADANGKMVKKVMPGDASEILGMTEALPTGSVIYNQPVDIHPQVQHASLAVHQPMDLKTLFGQKDQKNLAIILKTETSGEMEAIKEALPETVTVIFEGQGDVAFADIMMAKETGAFVIGFNVKISKDAQQLADNEKVFHRTYTIIYELLEEVSDALLAIEEEGQEKILGTASVLARFQGTTGDIIGLRVLEGRLRVQDTIRIMRGQKVVGESVIQTIKRVKDDVKEATKNMECGATLSPSIDFAPGDMLLSYS